MIANTRSELTELILKRINESKEQLKQQFFFQHPIKIARHFVLDDLLPVELAENVYESFPQPNQMHLLSISGKLKLKYSHLKDVPYLLQEINLAIQDPRVVAVIEEITEIKNQIPDLSEYAGGISSLLKGYYINPHLDLSHDVHHKYYRTVNVLYYVSPNWQIEYGGNYELWDKEINNRIIVPNLFNRMLVMETNRSSWHAVNTVLSEKPRCCVFNYFFSEQSPEDEAYFFKGISYRPRPEQKIRRGIELIRDTVLNKKW